MRRARRDHARLGRDRWLAVEALGRLDLMIVHVPVLRKVSWLVIAVGFGAVRLGSSTGPGTHGWHHRIVDDSLRMLSLHRRLLFPSTVLGRVHAGLRRLSRRRLVIASVHARIQR